MHVKALLAILGVGIVPAAPIVEYDIPTPNSAPHCLVAAPDGLIWFAEIGANKLGRFDPQTERFTEWPVPTVDGRPHGIAWASDGQVYFTEQHGNKIAAFDPKTERFTEYPLPHDGSGPHTPIQGPDGMLWFTEQAGNRIGRLDPATGRIVEYDVPAPRAKAYGINGSGRRMARSFAGLAAAQLGRGGARPGKGAEVP